MEQITVKEFEGGEVGFTRYIADNPRVSERLFQAISSYYDDYKITTEEHTVGSKRVDLIVRDGDNNVVQVIESQDANGWLDPVHASKIAWYCHDKGCNDGVLISEDCTEHMKTFIQWYNENTPLNIFLLSPTIIKDKNGEVDIFFKTILRPTDWAHKRIKPNTRQTGNDQPNKKEIETLSRIEELLDNHSDIFNGSSRSDKFVCALNVNNTGLHPTLFLRPGYYLVTLRHNGKHENNLIFESSVRELYENANFVKQYASLLSRETARFVELESAIEFVKQIINQINGGEIRVNDGIDV